MTEYQLMVDINDQLTKRVMEMMDKIYKELNNHSHIGNLGFPTSPPVMVTLPPVRSDVYSYKVISVNAKCDHKWQTYDSGWSKYEFCSKCDIKNV